MIILLLAAVLAPSIPVPGAPFQVLGGPAFETFVARTDAQCPGTKVRFIKPGTKHLGNICPVGKFYLLGIYFQLENAAYAAGGSKSLIA